MTIVTEYRLKCDYCGSVSPVMNNSAGTLIWPHGWVVEVPDVMVGGFVGIDNQAKQFCIPAHHEAWLAKQEKVKDEP